MRTIIGGPRRLLGRSWCSRHLSLALPLLAVVLVGPATGHAAEEPSTPIAIAVPELDYVDTSGELRDQRQEHESRLRRFSEALRSDLARSGKYRIVTAECGPAPCTIGGSPGSQLLAQARKAGAQLILIGGIHKESTLVQWAKVEAIDAAADRPVWDKLLTFRGDSDDAWDRAEAFVAREVIGFASSR